MRSTCRSSTAILIATLALGALWHEAARAQPESPSPEQMAAAHHRRGSLHGDLGQHDAAIAEYRKAYELKADPVFLFEIAQSYGRLGAAERAVFFYRSYLSALPDAPNRAEVEARIAQLAPALPAEPAASAAAAPVPVAAPPARSSAIELGSSAPPPPPPEASPYRRWWVWTVVGTAVAVGAAVTIIALSRRDQAAPPRSDLGNWKL